MTNTDNPHAMTVLKELFADFKSRGDPTTPSLDGNGLQELTDGILQTDDILQLVQLIDDNDRTYEYDLQTNMWLSNALHKRFMHYYILGLQNHSQEYCIRALNDLERWIGVSHRFGLARTSDVAEYRSALYRELCYGSLAIENANILIVEKPITSSYIALCTCYVYVDNLTEALTAATKAIEVAFRDWERRDAWEARAWVYDKMGNTNAAARDRRHAVEAINKGEGSD